MSGDESADSSPPNLRVAIEVADELIALVRGVGDHGGCNGDRTGLVMVVRTGGLPQVCLDP